MNQRICIVDDDAMYTMFMEDFLKSKGYSNIKTHATGEAFLSEFSNDLDFVILDFNLDAEIEGAKNGREVMEEIRNISKDVHIIMVSAQEAYANQSSGADKSLFYVVKGKEAFGEIHALIQSNS